MSWIAPCNKLNGMLVPSGHVDRLAMSGGAAGTGTNFFLLTRPLDDNAVLSNDLEIANTWGRASVARWFPRRGLCGCAGPLLELAHVGCPLNSFHMSWVKGIKQWLLDTAGRVSRPGSGGTGGGHKKSHPQLLMIDSQGAKGKAYSDKQEFL